MCYAAMGSTRGSDSGVLYDVMFSAMSFPLLILFMALPGGMGLGMGVFALLPLVMILNSGLVTLMFYGILRVVVPRRRYKWTSSIPKDS